jgi:hypothetical protein
MVNYLVTISAKRIAQGEDYQTNYSHRMPQAWRNMKESLQVKFHPSVLPGVQPSFWQAEADIGHIGRQWTANRWHPIFLYLSDTNSFCHILPSAFLQPNIDLIASDCSATKAFQPVSSSQLWQCPAFAGCLAEHRWPVNWEFTRPEHLRNEATKMPQ